MNEIISNLPANKKKRNISKISTNDVSDAEYVHAIESELVNHIDSSMDSSIDGVRNNSNSTSLGRNIDMQANILSNNNMNTDMNSNIHSNNRSNATVSIGNNTTMHEEKHSWTPEEDMKLRTMIESGTCKWSEIAVAINRSIYACQRRWNKFKYLNNESNKNDNSACNSNNNSKRWSNIESELLIRLISQYGKKWRVISNFIPNRSDASCHHHWYCTLCPKAKRNVANANSQSRERESVNNELGNANGHESNVAVNTSTMQHHLTSTNNDSGSESISSPRPVLDLENNAQIIELLLAQINDPHDPCHVSSVADTVDLSPLVRIVNAMPMQHNNETVDDQGRGHLQSGTERSRVKPAYITWQPEEETILKNAVIELDGVKRWESIAAKLPGRSGVACKHHWYNVMLTKKDMIVNINREILEKKNKSQEARSNSTRRNDAIDRTMNMGTKDTAVNQVTDNVDTFEYGSGSTNNVEASANEKPEGGCENEREDAASNSELGRSDVDLSEVISDNMRLSPTSDTELESRNALGSVVIKEFRKWTPEEDSILKELVHMRVKNWGVISAALGHRRTIQACKRRWKMYLLRDEPEDSLIRKHRLGHWTAEEDRKLTSLIYTYMQSNMNGIVLWHSNNQDNSADNAIPGDLNAPSPNAASMDSLRLSHASMAGSGNRPHGNSDGMEKQIMSKWEYIASQLPGRSVYACQTHWNNIKPEGNGITQNCHTGAPRAINVSSGNDSVNNHMTKQHGSASDSQPDTSVEVQSQIDDVPLYAGNGHQRPESYSQMSLNPHQQIEQGNGVGSTLGPMIYSMDALPMPTNAMNLPMQHNVHTQSMQLPLASDGKPYHSISNTNVANHSMSSISMGEHHPHSDANQNLHQPVHGNYESPNQPDGNVISHNNAHIDIGYGMHGSNYVPNNHNIQHLLSNSHTSESSTPMRTSAVMQPSTHSQRFHDSQDGRRSSLQYPHYDPYMTSGYMYMMDSLTQMQALPHSQAPNAVLNIQSHSNCDSNPRHDYVDMVDHNLTDTSQHPSVASGQMDGNSNVRHSNMTLSEDIRVDMGFRIDSSRNENNVTLTHNNSSNSRDISLRQHVHVLDSDCNGEEEITLNAVEHVNAANEGEGNSIEYVDVEPTLNTVRSDHATKDYAPSSRCGYNMSI